MSTRSFSLFLLLLGSCRSPTEMSLEIATDLPCSDVTEVVIRASDPDSVRSAEPVASTLACQPGLSVVSHLPNRVGSLVVVPSGVQDATVGIVVEMGLGGKTVAQCHRSLADGTEDWDRQCLRQARRIRYIPHDPLHMEVGMLSQCRGVACEAGQTCYRGACISDEVVSDRCVGEPGCGANALLAAWDFGDPAIPSTWRWVRVDAGTFVMGSPASELGREFIDSSGGGAKTKETPHDVTLSHPFEVLATETTCAQYQALMGETVGAACPECPMTSITWSQAMDFCDRLSDDAGLPRCDREGNPYECKGYRLPTDAEWEYAVRAGTTTATYNGDLEPGFLGCEGNNPILDDIAWFCGNTKQTQPVARKRANSWGLYDMLGNAPERCFDSTGGTIAPDSGEARTDPYIALGSVSIFRGLGYAYVAEKTRAAARGYSYMERVHNGEGFRPVRSLFE